ncbi:uncharacterized protein LOC115686996 isoform X1 [Syzygium oleosum]|uniref:uncharacterized protein LOC115686996 isoform X1 n=1 Tax=Syzygium oleosum TaxID=219896 RepID=UPI0024B92237|nr:uncharacterized protein LOC115686996 isoform X1 [Syzygium oleosum]
MLSSSCQTLTSIVLPLYCCLPASPSSRSGRLLRMSTQRPLHLLLKCHELPIEMEPSSSEKHEEGDGDDDYEEKPERVVQVPRQKYIPITKAQLLDAILMTAFDNQDDALQFLNVSRCLDAIIHAEHKVVLEDMRADYSIISAFAGKEESVDGGRHGELVADKMKSDTTTDGEEGKIEVEEQFPLLSATMLKNLVGSSVNNGRKCSGDPSRVAVATRFQRAFMQLLCNAQFEELSASDLMLTSALNTDYLLTLPIYVDWKRASKANAIIYRRGYATERQKGLLLVEKLDYIQSKLLQGILITISKPLGKLGAWVIEKLKGSYSTEEIKDWTKKFKHWVLEASELQNSDFLEILDGTFEVGSQLNQELPIWLAAQKAVQRYEGILSSTGPRGRLLRKLLTWTGLVPPMPETPFEFKGDNDESEPYLRPISISRISLSDIWRPVTEKYRANNVWEVLKTGVSILLSQSTLQEAAFQELVLLYTEDVNESDVQGESEFKSLQVKIYERIPIPDLLVIFPHKRLSFRIIDTVRLDIATVLGLLAYIINYKFEDIVSSPSAIFLDAIAISALFIFLIRVVLGYKQTRDRYQLLVNRTLYEKTLASGFGSVHFLLDASEQQQYKEAILAYAILLKANQDQVNARQCIGDKCEKFMYDTFKVQVDMPVDKAMDTLMRLGLVSERHINGIASLQAIPCVKAYGALKVRWNSMLS